MSSLAAQIESSPLPVGAQSKVCQLSEVNENQVAGKGYFHLGYRASLDGIRGFFMIIVMICHSGWSFIPGGGLSMCVFFVLSGFLITVLLMQEFNRNGSINLKHFYYRRILRILPALLLLLTVCAVYALTLPSSAAHATFKSIASTLFYVANWMTAFNIIELGPLAHTWSLAVEEQFYTFLPLILGVTLWLKLKRKLIILILLGAICVFFIHTNLLWEGTDSVRRIYYGTDARMDQLLIGCLIGILASWNILPKTSRAVFISKTLAVLSVVSIITLQFILTETESFMSRGATTLTAIASAAVIINLISSPIKPLIMFLEFPLLVWIGNISYGLYLWHFPIFRQVNALNLNPVLTVIVEVAITFTIAIFSYYFVEQPFLTLKKRLKPLQTAQADKKRI